MLHSHIYLQYGHSWISLILLYFL